jgi:hypothetical protein
MIGRRRIFGVAACAALLWLGLGVQTSSAQTVDKIIGSYFPAQLVPGQTNILHLALVRNNPVQSVEFTPSSGITVTGMTFRDLHQGSVWWEVTVVVAKDAAPGPRTVVAVAQTGRTEPITITIPDHLPNISNLKIVSAAVNQATVGVQFAVADRVTFDTSPYVWFVLQCGAGELEIGVVWGKLNLTNRMMQADIPNPRTQGGHPGSPAVADHCNLQLRPTDSSGADSNTLTSVVDFK